MNPSKCTLAIGAGVLFFAVIAFVFAWRSPAHASGAAVQTGNVWTISIGTPLNTEQDGEATYTIQWEYQEGEDGSGKKVPGTTTTTVKIPKGTTQLQKKALVLAGLQAKIPNVQAEDESEHNVYNVASGLNNSIQVGPNQGPPPPPFGNARIRNIKATDKKTNERDVTTNPMGVHEVALADVYLAGEITGLGDAGGSSVLSLSSSFTQGVIDISLDPSRRRIDYLIQIEDLLRAGGARTFLSLDGPRLYVLLSQNEGLTIGSDDGGLAVSVRIQAP